MQEFKKFFAIASGIVVSILGALITAMLTKEGNIWTRVKTFVAGVACGILFSLILIEVNIPQYMKEIIASGGAAFVSTAWPLLRDKYNKKIKDANGIQDTKHG